MTSPIQDKQPDVSLALVRAAAGGDLDAIKSLLASGADVNSVNESGQTPLILAAVMGHAEVVVHLISAGADPRLRDRLNLTALEWSTRRGFADVSRFLTRVSPPLQKPGSERETDSKKTDSETQPSVSVTGEAEPAASAAPAETSPTTSEQELSAELQTLAPQPELGESATSEISSEPAAAATESPTRAPVVADSPEVANELELEAASVESAAKSVPPRPSVEPSPAQISEPELKPASVELAKSPVTPLPVVDDSPAAGANQSDLEPASGKLATGSVTTPPVVDDSPAQITNEPELKQVSAAKSEIDSVPPLPAVDKSPAVVANEAESLASTESKSQPPTPIEPPSEVKDPVVTTPATSNLESLDQKPEAAAVPSWDPLLLNEEEEEEETLTQSSFGPSVFDFTLPDEPAPAAPSKTRNDPVPAIQIPRQEHRAAALSGSTLGLTNTSSSPKEVEQEAKSSNLKRCPRCGAVYQNSPLSFCTRDNATLLSINEAHQLAPPVQTSATPVAVWLLIAFVLGASGFAAYRLTQRFYRQPEPAPAEVKPIEAPPVVKKPAFTVGGDLAGSEVNIPEPEFPSDLLAAGVAGPITVRVRVNKNGRVISAATSNGDSRLRAAAVKAARLATFAPAKLAEMSPRGRAVAGTITYELATPQTNPASATTSTTATPGTSAVPSASANPNADPNAPVVSNELMSAATNVPAPDYPTRAKRTGIGGAITVTIRVNRAGRVISWRSSSGDSQLRAAAIKAARKATFAREKLPGNGDVVGTITYNFTP